MHYFSIFKALCAATHAFTLFENDDNDDWVTREPHNSSRTLISCHIDPESEFEITPTASLNCYLCSHSSLWPKNYSYIHTTSTNILDFNSISFAISALILIALVSRITLLEWLSKFAQCWVPRESVLWGSGAYNATSTAQNLKVTLIEWLLKLTLLEWHQLFRPIITL